MAESFNSADNSRAPNDDMIKQALKTELGHLKASDDLIGKTLDRCSAELDRNTGSKSFLSLIWNKTSLRYCATVVTACLIVLVFIVKYPSLFGPKSSPDGNMSIARTQAAADDLGASANTSGAESPLSKSANDYTIQASPTPAPELAPSIAGDSSNQVGLMFTESAVPKALNSLNGYGNNQARGNEAASVEALNTVVIAFNQNNGTQYSFDENRILSVSTVSKEGITSDKLRKTADYHEIIDAGNYWILPLKDNNGEISTLLPVFEAGIQDGSEPSYDVAITFSGEMWMSSVTLAISTDENTINLLLDGKALEKLVQDTEGVKQVSEVIIADINNGRDFMAFITADGKEYAIPLFMSITSSSLVNGQAYSLREALDGLAGYLDSG